MAEHIIAVRITVRCHTVTNFGQFLYRFTFYGASKIPFQAVVYKGFFCTNRFIESSRLCLRLVFQNCLGINQIHFLELLQAAEQICRIKGIFRRCHQTVFQTTQPSFYRILPFFVGDIKKICQNVNGCFLSIEIGKGALQLGSGLPEILIIRLPIMFQLIKNLFFLFQFCRQYALPFCQIL